MIGFCGLLQVFSVFGLRTGDERFIMDSLCVDTAQGFCNAFTSVRVVLLIKRHTDNKDNRDMWVGGSLAGKAFVQCTPVLVSLHDQVTDVKSSFGAFELNNNMLARVCTISDIHPAFALLLVEIGTEFLVVPLENLLDPFATRRPLPAGVKKPEIVEKVLLKDLLFLVLINKVFKFFNNVQPDFDNLTIQRSFQPTFR